MKPEDIEQCKLFDWIRSRKDLKPYCHHTANERQCHPLEGRLLKRKGVRKGVLDTKINIACGPYHGMYHELKTKGKKPTPEQFQFMKDMQEQGYFCSWSIGFEASKKVIEEYLALGKFSSGLPMNFSSVSKLGEWGI